VTRQAFHDSSPNQPERTKVRLGYIKDALPSAPPSDDFGQHQVGVLKMRTPLIWLTACRLEKRPSPPSPTLHVGFRSSTSAAPQAPVSIWCVFSFVRAHQLALAMPRSNRRNPPWRQHIARQQTANGPGADVKHGRAALSGAWAYETVVHSGASRDIAVALERRTQQRRPRPSRRRRGFRSSRSRSACARDARRTTVNAARSRPRCEPPSS